MSRLAVREIWTTFVRNKTLMWVTFQDAKLWNTRPSTLMTLEGDYICYCFDQAVAAWGNHVVNELESISGKNEKEVQRKRHNAFLKLMGAPDKVRFRTVRKPKK